MLEMAGAGAPISLDGVEVHPDCWCVCLCYLHFAPENPEDGEMYLLVRARPGCPGPSPESRKMVVCVCVCVCVLLFQRWEQRSMLYPLTDEPGNFSGSEMRPKFSIMVELQYLLIGV